MLSQNAKNLLNNFEEYNVLGFDFFSFRFENCQYRDVFTDLEKNNKFILVLICKALNCEPDIYNGNKQQLLDWLVKQ